MQPLYGGSAMAKPPQCQKYQTKFATEDEIKTGFTQETKLSRS